MAKGNVSKGTLLKYNKSIASHFARYKQLPYQQSSQRVVKNFKVLSIRVLCVTFNLNITINILF